MFAAAFLVAAVSAATPKPLYADGDNYWTRRLSEKAQAVKAGGSRVVFLGDEITHFFETGWGGKVVWEQYWKEAPYKALNLGFSGDTTGSLLWRITEGGELDGYEARAIVLMVGSCNIFSRGEPVMDTITGVKKVLAAIAERQPKARTVLCAILPRGRSAGTALREKIATVNGELQKFADGRRVVWCDMADLFLLPDGALSPSRMADNSRPSEEGYLAWTSAVMPMVNEMLAGGDMPIAPRCSSFPRPLAVDAARSGAIRPVSRVMERGGRGLNWWGERFARNRDVIADRDGKIDVVFAGDSITHFWESNGGSEYAALTNRYSVLNCGFGGDHTANLLWRFRHGELDGYSAKAVMVMIGTNDNGVNGRDPALTADGVKACLDEVAKRQPQATVLLCAILPRAVKTKDGDVSADGGPNARNIKTNELIKRFADGRKVLWIDFSEKFLEGGRIPKSLMADYIHPTESGYAIWRASVEPVLKKVIGR